MVKKVFVGVLIAAAFGLLVFGAVNRTMAKALDTEPLALNESAQNGGGGNRNGYTELNQNQVLDGGVDDCIADGEAYGVGAGDATGYGPGDGTGYVVAPEDGTGYGIGSGNGNQPADAPLDGTGIGIADVEEWITFNGTVQSVDSTLVVIVLEDGTLFELDGRTLSYITDLGFSLNVGDSVTFLGFYEDGLIEVGQITDLTTGASVTIRTDDGTPLWAGGGNNTDSRRGGGRR
jgi:hypothetical protein